MCARALAWAVLTAFFVVGAAATATAENMVPAPWRGEDRTSLQRWEFSTNANPAPADEYIGEFISPQATILNASAYKPELDGRQGIWPLGGQIFVTVQDYPEPMPEKKIWIQLTWEEENPGATPLVEAWAGVDKVDPVAGTLISQTDLPGNWWLSTYEITLSPNPPQETVHITHCIYVDELVIETQCMPEPATLSLLMAAGVVLLRRKRTA
jgi:hypothetical protein